MKVLNVMLSRGRGGLERAVIDAHEGLAQAGCSVVSVIAPGSWIAEHLPASCARVPLRSLGNWDPLARMRLSRIALDAEPDVILCHGNRSIHAAQRARRQAPVIAVCHTTNYSVLKVLGAIDGAIALTGHYREKLVGAGFAEDRIHLVPNAIRLGPEPAPPFERAVATFGGLGRIAPNKGFDVMIEACRILAAEGIPFRCVIGGVDENGKTDDLAALRDRAGLSADQVSLPGWIEEPAAFLRGLDVFVMSSRREVLSIALLEALEAGRPVVCTRVPGLETVFTEGREGLFVEIEDAPGLARAIAQILGDPARGKAMGAAARARARDFDLSEIGKRLRRALEELSRGRAQRA